MDPMGAIEKKVSGAASALTGGQAQGSAPSNDGIDLEELAEILFKKLREEILLENKRAGQG
jgi:hypothetical protein